MGMKNEYNRIHRVFQTVNFLTITNTKTYTNKMRSVDLIESPSRKNFHVICSKPIDNPYKKIKNIAIVNLFFSTIRLEWRAMNKFCCS